MKKHIHDYPFYGMGSQMGIWLEMDDSERAQQLLQEGAAIFAAAEQCLSRFRPCSELSQLNQTALAGPPPQWQIVSPRLWRLIQHALRLAAETDGLYDPTLLQAVEATGYQYDFKRRSHFVPQLAEPCSGGWEMVQLDEARAAIFLPSGVQLDLNGIAKGDTAQEVVDYLSQWGACLVDAGGDLTAGRAPQGEMGWLVGVAAPTASGAAEVTQWLLLAEASLATSGVDYRRWETDGRLYHHLIDPITAEPAESDLLTATVLAESAVRAEAWATAAMVAGKLGAHAYFDEQLLAAVTVDQDYKMQMTASFAAVVV